MLWMNRIFRLHFKNPLKPPITLPQGESDWMGGFKGMNRLVNAVYDITQQSLFLRPSVSDVFTSRELASGFSTL